jgi:hypothetical protein
MKKIFSIAVIALLGLSAPAFAQSKTDKAAQGVKKGAKKAWHGTKKGAKKVGDETAELATTGKAKVTDKKSEEWVGPEGQTIYVDDGSKYLLDKRQGQKDIC